MDFRWRQMVTPPDYREPQHDQPSQHFMLIVGLLGQPVGDAWIGIGLCAAWGGSLLVDWLLVRWLEQHVDGWSPWTPPTWRWLRT
jgi:hypothetical protein